MCALKRTWIDESFDVDASSPQLFSLLSDLDGWPTWTRGVKAVRRDRNEKLSVGSRFTLVIQAGPVGIPLPCEVTALDAGRIEWGGGIPGSVVRHGFELLPQGVGRTRVRHFEYATGLLAILALPLEPGILAFDRAWTRTIQKRFAS